MELIKQRFTYSIIDIIKDNCDLNGERVNEKKLIENLDLPLSQHDKFDLFNRMVPPYVDIKLEPFPKTGKRTKYFYNNTQKEYVSFRKLTKEPCYTSNERHLKRHYGNPFASIRIITTERKIELKGDKLHIKLYKSVRNREFNWKYFRKNTHIYTFTIDLKKGDFTIGEMNLGKMKKKVFRKNSFTALEQHINSNFIFNLKNNINQNLKIHSEYCEIFDDREFMGVINEYINGIPLGLSNLFDKHDFINRFVKFFVENKKIKTPNNYVPLIKSYYPTEKFLKKNDRKLVQSILDSFGINSKFTTKLFHENPKINLQEFSCFCALFGKDYPKYIGSIKSECIKFFINDASSITATVPLELRGVRNDIRHLNIDKTDKENIIKIVNSLVKPHLPNQGTEVRGLYSLFKDHFDMIEKIKDYDPNFKMMATNYTDFNLEHIEITKMCSLIKKGWSIEYQYDNRMVRLVEEEIKTLFEDVNYLFEPKILKREEEYSEEGAFMHHCVAGYANKETSMIISLRYNGGVDRVTCEFNKKTGECIQERHFCNKVPPTYFGESLEILKKRVKKFANQRLLNHIDIKKVKVKINGKEVNNERTEPDLFEQLLNGIVDNNF